MLLLLRESRRWKMTIYDVRLCMHAGSTTLQTTVSNHHLLLIGTRSKRAHLTHLHHDGQRLGRAIANYRQTDLGMTRGSSGAASHIEYNENVSLQTADCREVFTRHHQQRAALIIIVDIPLVAVECEFHILSY